MASTVGLIRQPIARHPDVISGELAALLSDQGVGLRDAADRRLHTFRFCPSLPFFAQALRNDSSSRRSLWNLTESLVSSVT